MQNMHKLKLLFICLLLATGSWAGNADHRPEEASFPAEALESKEGRFRVVGLNGVIIDDNLTQGERINRRQWARFTIEYVLEPKGIGSVVLNLVGPQSKRQVENVAPYFLYGDLNDGDQIFTRLFPAGNYSIRATAYSLPKGKGTVLFTDQVDFELYQPTEIVDFHLWNNLGEPVASPLEDGYTLMLDEVSGDKFNIQVETKPERVGSVELTLTGPLEQVRLENNQPYFLFGNEEPSGANFSRALPPGTYTLTARPYEKSGTTGFPGVPLTITFTVVGEMPALKTSAPDNPLFSPREERLQTRLSEQGRISVYPNPAQGPFVLNLPDVPAGESLQLWLADQNGQSYDLTPYVRNGARQLSLDREVLGLPRGVYFLHAQTGSRQFPTVQLLFQP